jgi:predicted enzyme related to lactoylglutathione lyase
MAQFYSVLTPFEIADRDISEDLARKVLSAHGMPRAGIIPVDEEANRSAWVPYVRVEDVEATLEKVVAGGGFTIVAPDENLHDGNVAVFVDPNGGVTGIVRYEYAEEASQ